MEASCRFCRLWLTGRMMSAIQTRVAVCLQFCCFCAPPCEDNNNSSQPALPPGPLELPLTCPVLFICPQSYWRGLTPLGSARLALSHGNSNKGDLSAPAGHLSLPSRKSCHSCRSELVLVLRWGIRPQVQNTLFQQNRTQTFG